MGLAVALDFGLVCLVGLGLWFIVAWGGLWLHFVG